MFGKKKINKSNQQYNLNYNAEDHFSIKQIIIFLVICLTFFFTMIFITVKFGFKGSNSGAFTSYYEDEYKIWK